MTTLWDRLLLWLCCSALLVGQPIGEWAVAATLVALTVSALNGYLAERRWSLVSVGMYTLFALFHPEFGVFLPLVYYDLLAPGHLFWGLVAAAALLFGSHQLPLDRLLPTLALLTAGGLLRQRTLALLNSHSALAEQRDSSRELSLHLEQQHQQLLEKQDYEIRLATLNERNRIAREIHDQVGHLLSRSLLQTAALLVTERSSAGANLLTSLHDTLGEAMDSIRTSVHNLHEESVDLQTQLQALVHGFLFCPIKLDYRLENEPEKAVQYCFLTAVKEGLHNITKHSNATAVSLTLLEHPAFYQLVLQDNGSKPGDGQWNGLGLPSMAERVQTLGGQFSAAYSSTGNSQSGFRVFISIPKGGKQL